MSKENSKQAHIDRLQEKHGNLETQIHNAYNHNAPDHVIKSLKIKKLHLKELIQD